MMEKKTGEERGFVCSFCGKHQDDVYYLFVGPGVNICVECVDLCCEIIVEHRAVLKIKRSRWGRWRVSNV